MAQDEASRILLKSQKMRSNIPLIDIIAHLLQPEKQLLFPLFLQPVLNIGLILL